MAERLPEGTVTILFIDVVGSTALGVTVGDRPARERMRAREALAREALARHRGQEIKGTGDGMMAAFLSARRGVDCAIDIQRAVERLNLAQPEQAVQLRIGLHCGEVFPERGDLFGSAANAAARIESLAGTGEIFVSETVRMLLGQGADYRLVDRGEFTLKGFDERWRLYEVGWREPSRAAGPRGRSPLVGRERERTTMSRWLDDVQPGRGLVGLLGGEPGVGKTRLAREAVAEAQGRGFVALVGHCYEMSGAPPYNPFVEMLEGAAHTLSAEALARVLGEHAAAAAKLAPRLRQALPGVALPSTTETLERRLVLEAVLGILMRLSEQQPLLLVFEDLHWLDASTAVLFQHVARRVPTLRIALLGTYRDTESFPERPFTAALAELERHERTAIVRPQRLPRERVADLLRAYGGRDAPPRVVDLVIRETEGNPFFVEQVLEHLNEGGRIFDAAGRWRTDVEVDEDEVPHGVRHVIARRLERVSAECRRVLTWAAIFGRAFSYELLREIADFADEEALLKAMDEAEEALLIAPETVAGESRLSFAHELIRQTLLGELSQARRRRLHARAADALEGASAASAERHVSDIAQHLHLAGPAADAARTVRYLTLSGKQALAAAAFEDAQRLFDAALKLLPESAPARAELLYQRGLAGFSAGRWDLVEPDWSAALDAAEKARDGALAGRTALDFSLQLLYATRLVDSIEITRRGLAAIGADVQSGVRARLLALLAMTSCDLRAQDFHTTLAQLREAGTVAAASGDRAANGDVSSRTAHLYWRHGLMADSAAEYERARALLDDAGDAHALAHARAWYTLSLVALGRFAAAAAEADELEQYCEKVGDPGSLFATRRAKGYMALAMTGDLARWNAFAADDLAFLTALGSRFTANSHAAIAYGRFWGGRWEEALADAVKARELAIDDSWAGACAGPLLLLHAYLGDESAARTLLEEERRHLPVAGHVNESGAWELLPAAVEALAVLGDYDAAAALYPVAGEAAESGVALRYITRTSPHTTAGMAAACAREWARAAAHFEAALELAHALPLRLEQPEARRWLAWMLLERDAAGDRGRAGDLLAEASQLYTELGMLRHAELAATLRRRPA